MSIARLLTISLIATIHVLAEAADLPKLKGRFLSDSVRIGEPVSYAISSQHASRSVILFIDSTFDFHPFEYISKRFFTTNTVDGVSKDSVIYLLRTFEPDELHEFALPVMLFKGKDTLLIMAEPDTLHIRQMINEIPEKAELKERTNFLKIDRQVNYPLFMFSFSVVTIIAGLLFLFFGRSLIRRYRLYAMYFTHKHFLKTFKDLQTDYRQTKDVVILEKALSAWKTYLSKLEDRPVETYTSTEIFKTYGKDKLRNGLQQIDRAIYGNILTEEVEEALEVLKTFTDKRFKKRKKQVRNERF